MGWLARLFGVEPPAPGFFRVPRRPSDDNGARRWEPAIPKWIDREPEPPPSAIALQHPMIVQPMKAIDERKHDDALLRFRAELTARRLLWPDEHSYPANQVWVLIEPLDGELFITTPKGETVARFGKPELKKYYDVLFEMRAAYPAIWCAAIIHGGFDARTPFNLELDIPSPTDCRKALR